MLDVFHNKVILVTGASSGIGKAIVKEASKQGATVLVHYRKNKIGAEQSLEEVKKYSKGDIFSADLSEYEEVKKLFKDIKKMGYTSIDYLVNNAGEAAVGSLDDIKVWDHQLKNILLSQVYTSNEFIKFNASESVRKIINISSVYGILEMGNPDYIQYSAAKAAVNSLTVNLAKKFAPKIHVNAVAPGYTLTPAWKGTSKEEFNDCENLTLIKRLTKPIEIASMVIELLSNDAITGEIIRIDGGLHLVNLK